MAKRGGQKMRAVGAVAQTQQAPKVGVTEEMYNEAKNANQYYEGKFEKNSGMSKYDELTIVAYSGGGYVINSQIYENRLTSGDKAFKRNLNNALDTLPVYKHTEPLYRGYADYLGKFKDVEAGDEFTLNTFTSSSKFLKVAEDFAGQGQYAVVFKIASSKTGRDIEKVGLQGEFEVLFKTDTKWRVKEVIPRGINGSMQKVITIEER